MEENRSPSPSCLKLNSETQPQPEEMQPQQQAGPENLSQTQAQLTPHSNSSSKLVHSSPRRKAPPPPGQAKSPPVSLTTATAGLENLDLAGVQLRSQNTVMAISRQRPRSEVITKNTAPPPPRRVGSLSIRSTPPPTSTSPIPVESITEVSEQEGTRELCNGRMSDTVESVAGKPKEGAGIESDRDKPEESKEETTVKVVVETVSENETVQLVTNAPGNENLEVLGEGFDDTSSLSSEGSGLVSAISPATKRRVTSFLSKAKEPLETVQEKTVELPSDFPPELCAEMVETMREM